MTPGGYFGHNATIGFMQVETASYAVTQHLKAVFNNRSRGFIGRCFDSQNSHQLYSILDSMNFRRLVKIFIPRKLFRKIEPYGHLAEAILLNTFNGFPGRK